MAPKSSDGETNDASSSQIQPTEPMETSAGVASSLLGKRKVETPNTCESEGDRESFVDEEEEEEDSDSDWDKDSFDGREYNPADDDGDYVNEEFEKMTRCYHRLVIETKGFFEPSDDFPPYIWAGISTIWDLEVEVKKGITLREVLEKMTSLCVEKYNRRKGKNVKLDQILRANYNPGGRTKYYITFSARESESPNAPLVEYQAKAVWAAGKTYPILCRPSPPPKTG